MAKTKYIEKANLLKKLGTFVGVEKMESPRGGLNGSNFDILFSRGRVFQSYNTLIAVRCEGKLYLTSDHDCSNTTMFYCKAFTGMTAQERRDAISKGEIIVIKG